MSSAWVRRLSSLALRPASVSLSSRWSLSLRDAPPGLAVGDFIEIVVGHTRLGVGRVIEVSEEGIELEFVDVQTRLVRPVPKAGWSKGADLAVGAETEEAPEVFLTGTDPMFGGPRRQALSVYSILYGQPPWRERMRVDGPWSPFPRFLDSALAADEYGYVTVDEIVDSRIGLAVAPWPTVDERGRLRFAQDDHDTLIGVDLEAFTGFIRRSRVVLVMTEGGRVDPAVAAAVQEREVAIGDVFAIPTAFVRALGSGELERLSSRQQVYDVTFAAREQSKLAVLGATRPRFQAAAAGGEARVTEWAIERGFEPDRPQPRPIMLGPDGEVTDPEFGPYEGDDFAGE